MSVRNRWAMNAGYIVVIAMVIALSLYGCHQRTVLKEPNEIVLGFNSDQSGGGTMDFGISARQGFEIAIDEINAKGGILGKKIRPVIMDDKGKPDISEENMQHLVFDEKAIGVIGPANSGNALRWIPIAQENKVVVVIPIATATAITQKYMQRVDNYIFRVSLFDQSQTRMYVPWALRKSPNDRIAILHDNTGYGTQGLLQVTEGLSRWGVTPVAVESFSRDDDLETLKEKVRAVKDSRAEAVCIFCLADSSGYLLEAINETPGFDAVLFSTWANAATDMWKIAGPLAEKVVFPFSTTADLNERTRELNQKIIDRYGEEPLLFIASAQSYDSVMLLAKAIENAGTLDSTRIRDELENVRNVQGVIKFYEKPFSRHDHEGLGVEDLFLAHWEDGRIVVYEDEATADLEIR